MGQSRTGSVSSFQHWSTVWLLKRMGFYRILSPRYLIRTSNSHAFFKFIKKEEVGCVQMCSLMQELWLDTQETGDIVAWRQTSVVCPFILFELFP